MAGCYGLPPPPPHPTPPPCYFEKPHRGEARLIFVSFKIPIQDRFLQKKILGEAFFSSKSEFKKTVQDGLFLFKNQNPKTPWEHFFSKNMNPIWVQFFSTPLVSLLRFNFLRKKGLPQRVFLDSDFCSPRWCFWIQILRKKGLPQNVF